MFSIFLFLEADELIKTSEHDLQIAIDVGWPNRF